MTTAVLVAVATGEAALRDPLTVATEAVVIATDARSYASRAEVTATEALTVSRTNEAQLLGLAVSQQRTERSVSEHKVRSEERHAETLAAIDGAKASDKKQAHAIEGIRGEISNAAALKIASAVAAVLLAIAGAITVAATQLAPLLPSLAQRYVAPVPVVVTVAAHPVVLPVAPPADSK